MRRGLNAELKCPCGAVAACRVCYDIQGDGCMTGEMLEVIDNDEFVGGNPACNHDDAEICNVQEYEDEP